MHYRSALPYHVANGHTMATIDDRFAFNDSADPLGAAEAPAGFVFAPVPSKRKHEALSLLLTGDTQGSRPAVDQFLQSAAGDAINLEQLWGAFEHDTDGPLRASMLLLPSPGRTAITFLSPLGRMPDALNKDNENADDDARDESNDQAIAAALTQTVLRAQDGQSIHLAQALLMPSQKQESEALAAAGFTRLAHLVYMQRLIEPRDATRATPLSPTTPSRLATDSDIEIHEWHDEKRHLFASAILASYEQTADCPGLIGMRDIDDIINGHQATGTFDPELWTVITRHGEALGVLLLNRAQNRQGLEIVYLGLAKTARGQGFGKRLVDHAIATAHALKLKTVVLAVDELNTSAMTLYRKSGFTSTTRKLAMIRSLRD